RLAGLDAEKPIGAVVYCAGHVEPQPFLDIDDESWDYHLAVNLTAAAHVLQWAVEAGVEAVVLVASTAALRPSPGWAAYSAAKAGLVNLGLTVAEEAAGRTRVYVVAPGRCATHLRAVLAPDEDPATIMQPPEVAEVIRQLIVEDPRGVLAGQVVEVKRKPDRKPPATIDIWCRGCGKREPGGFGDAKFTLPQHWRRDPSTQAAYCRDCP